MSYLVISATRGSYDTDRISTNFVWIARFKVLRNAGLVSELTRTNPKRKASANSDIGSGADVRL